ncbi:hypothetical protein SAMN05421738_1142 [Algoriella xinjiangensis]|uniref:DUF2004 domain-containing protein n=1 Tax=Algoriella xinjiangensis TaxID=684065 RepID=A0A1I4ZN69_9FLAO|nr:DUF2004 domain-containing protein [Algoriella xinjiangensis]SFN51705.1 hypothetical protein SAMN05421738_1142 [Algoriella xinjiangensis]
MTEYTLPHFGKLQVENLEEYYNVDIELGGKEIQIDLNFENKTINIEDFDTIKHFIENIENFDKQNQHYIKSDYDDENGNTVKEYVTFHIEELGEEFLEQINIDNQTDKEQQFLTKLNLTRVGIYPDGKYDTSYFAVFDYTVNKELTDQLIVVKTDNKGNLDHLSWES